jgi:hypothetical protein
MEGKLRHPPPILFANLCSLLEASEVTALSVNRNTYPITNGIASC